MTRKTLTQRLQEAEDSIQALAAENEKLRQKVDQGYGPSISGCVIKNKAASVNRHTAAALTAAAEAAKQNAMAIQEIAKSLKGSDAHMTHGIYLGSK